jgi:putative tricarboxylic transport membrane protein
MAGSSTDVPAPAARRRRTLELATAIGVALVGAVVAADSLTHDVRWNENGPAPGYFPFRIGVLLVASSVALIVRAMRTPAGDVFATGAQLRRTASVLWPTVIAVLAMFPLGCYVPSAVYLAWMMHAHGPYGWPRAAAVALLATTLLFVTFELWFQVPLAKGPLEAAFGIY